MLSEQSPRHVEMARKASCGLIVAALACFAFNACSEPFTSCKDTQTCPPDAAGAADAGGSAGTPAHAGTSQLPSGDTGGAGTTVGGAGGATNGAGGSAEQGGSAGARTGGASGGSAGAGGGGAELSLPPSGLALRMRADVGIALNGETVESWADQSGKNRHASQTIAGARPAYLTNWKSGKPAVRFDAVDDMLTNTTAIFGSADDITLFVVGARETDPDTAEVNDKWFGLVPPGKLHRFQTVTVSTAQYVFTDVATINVHLTAKFGMATNPAYVMWASDGDGGEEKMQVRVNGIAKPTDTDMANFPDNVHGFEIGGANTAYGAKKIGEVIAYNRVLTTTEIAQVEDYIVKFWGAF